MSAEAPACGARGWHGMTARNQTRYLREDWGVFLALGAGDILVVDVVDRSPAWDAGIRNGAWVLEIDGRSFAAFASRGGPVGALVKIKTFHAIGGFLEATLTLAAAPKKDRVRRSRLQHCQNGRKAYRSDRPRWEAKLAESGVTSSAVRVGAFLSNTACGNDGWTSSWPCARIAARLNISRATVHRALRQLREAGFILVHSGQRSRRANKISMTFPLAQREAVVVPFPDRSAPRERWIEEAPSRMPAPKAAAMTAPK